MRDGQSMLRKFSGKFKSNGFFVLELYYIQNENDLNLMCRENKNLSMVCRQKKVCPTLLYIKSIVFQHWVFGRVF